MPLRHTVHCHHLKKKQPQLLLFANPKYRLTTKKRGNLCHVKKKCEARLLITSRPYLN